MITTGTGRRALATAASLQAVHRARRVDVSEEDGASGQASRMTIASSARFNVGMILAAAACASAVGALGSGNPLTALRIERSVIHRRSRRGGRRWDRIASG